MDRLSPPEIFFKVLWDIIISILFLAGITVVDVVLRPLFESHGGVPLLADFVLTIVKVTLILGLLRHLVREARGLAKELIGAWTDITSQSNLTGGGGE